MGNNRVLVSVMGGGGCDGCDTPSTVEMAATQPPTLRLHTLPLRGAEAILLQAMDYLKLDGEEVSVSFCTDSQIKDLNNAWRGIDESTDVLSFEDGDEYTDEDGLKRRIVGDIVISYETLSRAQEEVGEDADAELRRLLVHGLLHLNGYDHGEEHLIKGKEPVCEMLKLQEKVCSVLTGCGYGSI